MEKKLGKIAIVRIRGLIGVDRKIEDTLRMLGLKRRFSVSIKDSSPAVRGMLTLVSGYVAWGEASSELQARLKGISGLKSPKKGFTAIKQPWPRGDAGYRGDKIGELVERML